MGTDCGAPYLIVGLGNPGPEYQSTPHNLGFLTIDRLASEAGIRVTRPEENSLVGRGEIAGRPIVLAKPLSFMNCSGGPVRALLSRYEVEPGDTLVIFDDLALPWDTLRLRLQGSAGGHNGVASVIDKLGTNEFPRLRLGIDPGRPYGDGADFVLRPFGKEQKEQLDDFLDRAAEAVRLYLSDGAAKAMTEINRRADGEQEAK
jgi:PTH1 family peptidyl-tRNA hydrolase